MSNKLDHVLEKLRQADNAMFTLEGDKADEAHMLILKAMQEIREFQEMLYNVPIPPVVIRKTV